MLTLACIALVLQDKTAEELVAKAEEKLLKAGSWQVKLTVATSLEGDPPGDKGVVTYLVADKNRMLLTMDPVSWVCDGKKLDRNGDVVDAPADLTAAVAFLLVRGELSMLHMVGTHETSVAELRKLLPASDYTLGAKEKVGDRESRIVEFTILMERRGSLKMKLWLDAETGLPLKRTATVVRKDGKTPPRRSRLGSRAR
jgi:hypothetical protein